MESSQKIFLPPEWYPQSGVMLTWPHKDSDWMDYLDEVTNCFILIANEILENEKLLIVTPNPDEVASKIEIALKNNLILAKLPSNDTWARDHGAISVFVDGQPFLFDFQFNGWGLKFPACLDNQLTTKLFQMNTFQTEVGYANKLDFVLEGGSFEVDGKGTLLTTKECLLSVNRNQAMSLEAIEAFLMKSFDIQRVLWLSSGYLAGDDTDSHIDTLVRFCDANTIAYVKCCDASDEHYLQLQKMEEEIKSFKTLEGNPYQLIELPMAERIEDKCGNRLPATYANFLIINNKVLVPTYGTAMDQVAINRLKFAFPDRQIVGIDCSVLIQQHGSLHCVTMQFPLGIL